MFAPQDLYEHKQHKDFTPRRALSIAQIIAAHTVDVETVALIWLLLERGASLTVAGPTEPRPGAGKSTALHALLQFLPKGVSVAYMFGMFETFAFTRFPDVDPTKTYALCNEISDHNPTYMWGSVARRYLMLPTSGYHIATSVHADTIDDVLHMYQHDLHLRSEDIRRLGLVVNIGLVEQRRSLSRRWSSTYFLLPNVDPEHPETIVRLPLSLWNKSDDTFEHADSSVLLQLTEWAGLPHADFTVTLKQRVECLKELAAGKGADMMQVYEAVATFRERNR